MKKLLYSTYLFLFPVLILVLTVNYIGDAGRLFSEGYEKKMTNILLSGHHVTNLTNYDERLFQKEIIFTGKMKSDIVVLGSSRAMQINSPMFPNQSFYNNSVSGAALQDLIAIYQIYKENRNLPTKIIIGIDPWNFKADEQGAGRWQSIAEYYYNFNDAEAKNNEVRSKYQELYSLSYFQSSIKLIPKKLFFGSNPEPSNKQNNSLNTKLIDGSLVYNEAFRNASKTEIESKIKKYISGEMYQIENMKKIDTNKFKEFEKLIPDMKKNNVEVEFFLAPYAPVVYDVLQKKYDIVLTVEQAVRNFAALQQIKVYGSYNPSSFGFDNTYFYDGMHCKENAIQKILEQSK